MIPSDTWIPIVVGVLSSGGLVGVYTAWRTGRSHDKRLLEESRVKDAAARHAAFAAAEAAVKNNAQQFELNLMQQLQRYQEELGRVAERHRNELDGFRTDLRQCREDHSVEIEKRIILIERIANLEGQLKAMPMVPVSFGINPVAAVLGDRKDAPEGG